MKKVFKWIGIVLLSPVLLFLILAALLYVPPIQNWVVQKVVAYASEQTGMHISVEHVDMDFPLDLGIDGVLITQPADGQPADTIAHIRRAVADVRLWPLLSGNIILDALELNDAKLNTLDFIGDLRLQGTIGQLSFTSPGIDTGKMTMELRSPRMSNTQLNVFMSDTAAVDTSTVGWHIRFDRFDFEKTCLNIIMDSAAVFNPPATRISAQLHEARISDADIHLGLARFAFGKIDWQQGALSYNDLLSLSSMSLSIDSLYSYGDDLRLAISQGSMREDSTGLELTELYGGIDMNGERLMVNHFVANTPHSHLAADARLNFSSLLEEGGTAQSFHNIVDLEASLGKDDVQRFMPSMPTSLWPDMPLALRARMDGNAATMNVERLSLVLPTVVQAEASGQVGNLADFDHLLAQLDVKAEALSLDPLLKHFGLPADYSIPKGLRLEGSVGADGQEYSANLTARDGMGSARLKGKANMQSPLITYNADIAVDRLNLRRFMPRDSIGLISADVQLKGRGLDVFDHATHMEADVQLHSLHYGSWLLDSIQATANISSDHALISATSANALLGGQIEADVLLASSQVKGTVEAQLEHIDMQALGITEAPMVMGLSGSAELDSDLKLGHRVSLLANNIYMRDTVSTLHSEKLGLLLKTGQDTTVVRVQSGDFIVKFDSRENYEQLLGRLSTLADSIQQQISSRTIDQPQLKQLLPTGKLYVTSQNDNPIADFLRTSTGISFKNLHVDLTTSPATGVNGQSYLLGLNTGSMRVDTLRLSLVEKSHGLTFNGQATNNRKNPSGAFNVLFDGLLQQHGASFGVRYFDEQDRLNIRLGAKAEMVAIPGPDGLSGTSGLRFQLIPSRPTLGYKEFALNADNFLLLHENLKMEANVALQADDGTRIELYTAQQDSTLLQDFTISTRRLDLHELTSGITMLPKLAGILEGDYHLTMDQQHNISVASDMQIQQMAYEGSPIGNLGSEFVYLLREDDTHVVDAALSLDDEPIGTLRGSYFNGKRLDATVELTSMPLSIVNGFMPDQLLGFEGKANGTLDVKGPLSELLINGELRFTDGYLVSNPYGMRMRFGDKPVKAVDSKLLFEDFALYSYNNNPLNINGSVDLNGSGTDAVNLRLRSSNLQLINAKQKKESVAYGRMFVNFFARLSGNLDQLMMRGRLDVLGTTDLNYILLDSPLSTDNQMDELVRFTDFSDTTLTVVQRPETDALDLDMQLNIDQGAHVRCALNAEQTNYVDLLGGGDLRLKMNAEGMQLNGRYTIGSGTMKYSLPVIPLKTFTIQDGSYVEFTGQADNPTLNITATERNRASVGNEDGQTRTVIFDCGVVITRTLADMGLQFTISAPEDGQMQSELASMSVEQRGKLAVTMLTTGMYLADGNTSAFSMNAALSSFLQSEINNITAGALKTVDLQLGLDNTTDASGQTRTDYSFRFAKRFWNNRLNVQIGGKVSSGAELEGQQQSFFDNVSMEYRLSPTSNQYVKLFYKQNVYDWLEGYTGEYGAGFIWKRKLDKLTDIFRSSSSLNDRQRILNYQGRQRPDSIQPRPTHE